MSDITWIQAFLLLIQIFKILLADTLDIADDKITGLVDTFMDAILAMLKAIIQVV